MKQLLGRSPDISGTKNGEKLLPGSSREDTVGYNKQYPQQHGWNNRVCTEMNVRNCYSQDYLQISIMHMKYRTQIQSCQKYNFLLLYLFEKWFSIIRYRLPGFEAWFCPLLAV